MKKIRQLFLLTFSVVVAISIFAGCGNSDGTSSQLSTQQSQGQPDNGNAKQVTTPEYTFRASSEVPEEHLLAQSVKKFADLVNEYSNGRINIEVYYNNVLGTPREVLEATQFGTLDFCETPGMLMSGYTNRWKFFNMPFMWDSKDASSAFLETDLAKETMDKIAEETGILMVGLLDNGFLDPYLNIPVETPNDVKKLKIRVQETDVWIQTWKDLGANATPLAFTEVYTALQQGAMDGQANQLITIDVGKFDEVSEYMIKLGMFVDRCVISMNYDLYESLPEELQEVIIRAGNEASEWSVERGKTEFMNAYNNLIERGIKVVDLSSPEKRQLWIDATKPTYDWFRASFPEIDFDAFLEVIAECNAQYPPDPADGWYTAP